jgi:hypothetical protein
MDLEIYRDNRTTGKYYHKMPYRTYGSKTKYYVYKEITKYIHEHDDFGCVNYLPEEANIVTRLCPYTTYVYEDLY